MSAILRLFNRISLLVRYHRDWRQTQLEERIQRPRKLERQFPHDYLIYNTVTFYAEWCAVNFGYLPEDVEGLCIGDMRLFKEKALVKHELLTRPIVYHNEIVGWGVTERGWRASARNGHKAVDKMYFRSTKAIAEVDANVSDCTLQCTFKPRPDAQHSFIKFILICFSANKFSLDYYRLLERNYYFYSAVVVKLLVMIVGGEIEYREYNCSSMAKNFRLTIMESEEVAKAVEEIKEIYDAEYDRFMAVRSKVLAERSRQRRIQQFYARWAQALDISEEGVAELMDELMDDPEFLALIRAKAAALKLGGEATAAGAA